MEIPELAIDKECENLYHIYLFYIEEKWWCFGHSAHYLSMIYPKLETVDAKSKVSAESIPCVCVPDSYLLNLFDCYDTLVSDTCIQVSPPPAVYCYWKEYDMWREQLTVD